MNQNTNNTQTIEDVCEFLNEQMQFFEQTAEVQRAIDNLMEGITLYFNAEATLFYKKNEDRYTLGNPDEEIRKKAMQIAEKSIELAVDLGVRTVMIPGYDIYFGESTIETKKYFLENVKKIAISVEYDAIPRKYTTIEELPEELYELADCNKVEIQSVDLDGDGKKEYIVASNSYASPEDYDTDTYTNYSDISLYDNKFKKIAILVKAKDQFREVDGKITSEFFCCLDDVEYIDIDDDGIMEVLVDLNYWENIGVNSYKYKDGKITGETECEINPLAISNSSPNHIKSEEQNITKENSNVLNEKTSKITDEMLIGDWEFKNATDKSGNEISSMEIFGSLGTNGYFTFLENERFTNNLTGGVSSEFIDEGKYTIKNDTMIELKYDDGRKGELTFLKKNGNKVLMETENNYILYLSKRTSSNNSNDLSDNSDIIGKWNTYEMIDSKTAKVLEPREVFGSGYGGISYLELKEDGTFKDFISPISSSEFIDEGKYEIKRNYNRNGDCYVILNYLDGRSLTLQKEYLSSDNIPSLVVPLNSKGDYEYHLKK